MKALNKKVGVLFGGDSAEREVSLRSGNAVLAGLLRKNVDAVGIDIQFSSNIVEQLAGIDIAFIALHGRGGEDGKIQALLEILGIPYTGSGVMASALGMDKLRTKQLWLGAGLPTPEFYEENNPQKLETTLSRLGGIAMVKPALEGSSIGMSRVTSDAELKIAVDKAYTYCDSILVERWITGEEYTCAVINQKAMPVIRLKTDAAFYDFDAKYHSNTTEYLCPCGLEPDDEKALQTLCMKAFNVLGCQGWGRVDVMRDQQGKFWLLEVNTSPGMTDHSLVPMAANAAGLEFDDLLLDILAGVSSR